MDSTTMAIIMAVTAFAVFGVLYVVFGARRGKAEGHTDRTWCLPQGHGDIDVRSESGREIAPAIPVRPHRPRGREEPVARKESGAMTDAEKQEVANLLDRLDVATGEIMPRDGRNAPVLTELIECVNGLRSLLGIVRPH